MRQKYGLINLPEQYVTYIRDIVKKFDFGPSLFKQRGRNVIDIISDGLKTSAKLGVIAAFSALICGIVLGSVAALRRTKVIDKVIMVCTTAFVSMCRFYNGIASPCATFNQVAAVSRQRFYLRGTCTSDHYTGAVPYGVY